MTPFMAVKWVSYCLSCRKFQPFQCSFIDSPYGLCCTGLTMLNSRQLAEQLLAIQEGLQFVKSVRLFNNVCTYYKTNLI